MEGKPDTDKSLMGNVEKASWRPLGWLEMEWWEVQVTLSEEVCERSVW